MKHHFRELGIGAAILVLLLGAKDENPIKVLERYHKTPGKYCTEFDGTQLKECNPQPADCIFVRRIDDRHAYVHAYSRQSYGDECEAEGTADLAGGRLLLTNKGQIRTGEQVEIYADGQHIRFRYPKESMIEPFCGSHANLELVELPIATSAPEIPDMCGRRSE